VKEAIDNYRPDLIYFDSRLNIIDERRRIGVLTYYYNRSEQWDKEVCLTYKVNDLPEGVAILDIERGSPASLTSYPWLTDDAIDWNSWCNVQYPDYKSTERLIHELVDTVSKN
jgi:alpha-L-fucosidase